MKIKVFCFRMAISLFFTLALFFTGSSVICAQEGVLPENKFFGAKTWREHIRESNRAIGGLTMGYGYHQSQFFNARFEEVIQREQVAPTYGDYLQLRYTAAPFFFEVNRFSSRFSVEEQPNWPYSDTTQIRHKGWEFGLGYFPIHQGFFSKYVVPFLGISYQTSSICASCGWDEDKELQSSIDASTLVWKTGLRINFTSTLGVNASYKQSLNLSDNRAFSQIAIGLIATPDIFVY